MSILAYNADKISVNLSPLEHKVYFSFYEREVIRNEDIYKTILNKKTEANSFQAKYKGVFKTDTPRAICDCSCPNDRKGIYSR